MMIENSFFNRFRKKRILILVPHPDDEINIAGSVIYGASLVNSEIFIVYATNGDYEYRAEVRLHEAINASMVLGVPENHIIFMGYGDTLNVEGEHSHIFYSQKNSVISHAGRKETYGIEGHPEYIYTKEKIHHAYSKHNYCADLENIILSIRAEYIFAVDFDWHADHRMLSLSFEQVMGKILRQKGNTYRPYVYKAFAYCTAYETWDDFYAVNLGSTLNPDQLHDKGLTGLFLYKWSERIRFPVPDRCWNVFLKKNILFKALCCHYSQSAGLHAGQIINSDKIFWMRRTDSISYQADITCTSSLDTVEKVCDFSLVNTNDIDRYTPCPSDYCWIPEKSDMVKMVTFSWDTYQEISYFRIFCNISSKSRISKLKIEFDTGYSLELGALPVNGNPISRAIPIQKTKKCSVQILEYSGEQVGLSECEFYSQNDNIDEPFIKIMVNDNFIYQYILDKRIRKLPLQIYRYATENPVYFEVLQGGKSYVDDKILYIDKSVNSIVIKASVINHPEIYDKIVIYRLAKWKQIILRIKQQYERFCVRRKIRKIARKMAKSKQYLNNG